MRGGHLLQVIDVVDEDAFQLVDCRIDIPWHGYVDEKHGPIAAAMQKSLGVFAAKNGMRRACRSDDDIGLAGRFMKLVEGNDAALELIGHALCAFESAVGDEDGACALLNQMAGSQFAHFAGTDQEHGAPGEGTKILRARSTATEAIETLFEPISVSERTFLAAAKAPCSRWSSWPPMVPATRATA